MSLPIQRATNYQWLTFSSLLKRQQTEFLGFDKRVLLLMAMGSASPRISSIWNTTYQIDINQNKTRQWIFGVLIGSAPFLLIVICWIFVLCSVKISMKYCRCVKTRQRSATNTTQTLWYLLFFLNCKFYLCRLKNCLYERMILF